MRHKIPFLLLLLASRGQGQTLVSDQPQQRTVLLEEYTAINCGNCPVGHALAADLLAAYPGQVAIVAVHGGGLAVPAAGQPDLRSTCGTDLWQHYSVISQPRAAINRIPVGGQATVTTSAWASAVSSVLATPSPVNLGLASMFDPGPRLLTVTVELFYTADGPGAADRITVELVQDHIIGYQQDYQNGAQPNYDHVHVLRACIPDIWGDEVTTTSSGTLVQRTYTYTVPTDWEITDCAVVASVGEFQGEIYQARSVAADGGSTTGEPELGRGEGHVAPPFPVPADDNISIPLRTDEQAALLHITDHSGRRVKSLRCAGSHMNVAVQDLAPGTYLFAIQSTSGVRTGRFTIAR